MTSFKIGTGTNYASITGFTWPTGLNPEVESIPLQKKIESRDMDRDTININMSWGNQDTVIGLTGNLFTESDKNNLRKQANLNKRDSTGTLIDSYQKLYLDGSTFFWVMPLNFTTTRNANLQGAYPYNLTLKMIHPYEYYDSITSYTVTTANTTATITGIDNDGTAEVFPVFEIINTTGSSITGVSIAYGSSTLTWTGTLEAAKSLLIIQEHNPDYELETTWRAYKYDSLDLSGTPTNILGLKGDRIILPAGTEDATITATLTGNDASATFNAKFRERLA